ncbi:Rep family protein [Vagococcus carniphilus]|uniref:Uncharacterized protein n=1 Tax=Vagococcus carniphilus TaxID=218144 RepID=A0A430ARW5_9ENTE|nr:Rep family protein [Vagococcus carniphilus]QNN73267.1 replication protein [Vagococcus carniphilus]RSU10795.1 hypothetical protein CBF28_12910 [Vagococcus carniphilus]
MSTKRKRERNMMYVQKFKYLPFENLEEVIKCIETKIKPTEFAAIIHDKDEKDDGSLKDEHIHVMLHFENARSIENIAKLLKDKPQSIQKWDKKLETGYSYLIHETENSKHQHQYDPKEVTANFNYLKRIEKIRKSIENNNSKKKKEKIKIDELLDLLLKGKISKDKLEASLNGSELAKYHRQIEVVDKKREQRRSDRWIKARETEGAQSKTIWVFGSAGTGKTQLAKKRAEKESGSYYIGGSSNDPFQNYIDENIVILDELRPNDFEYSDLLRMFDPHNFRICAPSRYQNKNLTVHTFIVTTPYSPKDFFKKIIKIKGKNFDSEIDTFFQLARRLDEVIHITQKENRKLTYDKKLDDFI